MATSSIHHRDHVTPDGHRFAGADENPPTVVMHTVTVLVRDALGVVYGDKVYIDVVKMDGQARWGGPGEAQIGGFGAPNGDESALQVVVRAVFLSVHDDHEHLGVDYELYRAPLKYTWEKKK